MDASSISTFALAALGPFALIDENSAGASDRFDIACQIIGKIDNVRVQIAGYTGARDIFIHAPEQRNRRVHGPILQVKRSEMIDLADAPFIDQLPRKRDGRYPAVVEPDGIDFSALASGRGHVLRFFSVHRQRFFARHDFAGLECGEGDIVMRVVRRADVDDLDLRVVDNAPPVVHRLLPPPALGHLFDFGFVAAANRFEARPQR